jgi:hypothetical protein
MRPKVTVSVCAGLILAAAALAGVLASQGLTQASLWAAVLGLPAAVIAAAAGVWATVLAAKPRQKGERGADAEPDAATGQAHREVQGSGSVRQKDTHGTAVAHTGSGDINIGQIPARKPDEPS